MATRKNSTKAAAGGVEAQTFNTDLASYYNDAALADQSLANARRLIQRPAQEWMELLIQGAGSPKFELSPLQISKLIHLRKQYPNAKALPESEREFIRELHQVLEENGSKFRGPNRLYFLLRSLPPPEHFARDDGSFSSKWMAQLTQTVQDALIRFRETEDFGFVKAIVAATGNTETANKARERVEMKSEPSDEAAHSGLKTQLDFKSFVYTDTKVHPEACYALAEYLMNAGHLPLLQIARTVPPATLHWLSRALRSFVDVSEDTVSQFPLWEGTYLTYRLSTYTPGHVVKGKFMVDRVIDNSLGLDVFVTLETNIHRGKGIATATERFVGVMLSKSGTPFIVSCRHIGYAGSNISRGAPRFTLVNSAIFDSTEGKLMSFVGVTLATFASGNLASVLTCFERVDQSHTSAEGPAKTTINFTDDESLDNSLGTFLIEDKNHIPPRIRARLSSSQSNFIV